MDLPAGFARHDVALDGLKVHSAQRPHFGPRVVLRPGQWCTLSRVR